MQIDAKLILIAIAVLLFVLFLLKFGLSGKEKGSKSKSNDKTKSMIEVDKKVTESEKPKYTGDNYLYEIFNVEKEKPKPEIKEQPIITSNIPVVNEKEPMEKSKQSILDEFNGLSREMKLIILTNIIDKK